MHGEIMYMFVYIKQVLYRLQARMSSPHSYEKIGNSILIKITSYSYLFLIILFFHVE